MQNELDTGELIQCFPALRARYAHYLVHPRGPVLANVAAFKTWLKAQPRVERLQKGHALSD